MQLKKVYAKLQKFSCSHIVFIIFFARLKQSCSYKEEKTCCPVSLSLEFTSAIHCPWHGIPSPKNSCFDIKVLALGFQISHAMLNANLRGKFKRRIFYINVYNVQSDAKMMCREKQHQILWLEIEIQSKIFQIIENLNFSFILSLGKFGFEIPCPKTGLWGSPLSWMQDFLEPHGAISATSRIQLQQACQHITHTMSHHTWLVTNYQFTKLYLILTLPGFRID